MPSWAAAVRRRPRASRRRRSAWSLEIAGNTAIDATPSVTSTDGKPVTDSLIALPSNPLVTGGVINASAENGKATANVAGLGVGDGLLSQAARRAHRPARHRVPANHHGPQRPGRRHHDRHQPGLISGPLGRALDQAGHRYRKRWHRPERSRRSGPVQAPAHAGSADCATCSRARPRLIGATAVEAQCTGDTGTTTIADLAALGLPVNIDTNKANASVSIPGLLTLTVNRQTKNADGTFTVDALYVNLLGQVDLTVASATCGNVTTDTGPTTPTETDAPTPTPIESHVPVTG
ncbi:hypothetical protein G5V59_26735 [Nocardioides sp. W3-2-3]|uniref:choice-of-anchor P family protein n=1 Tax=Nocardioides convexus TaxID=2712224 RepID=UPI0024185988|nr:choice-of-anchor P family protein [Nocardioides convexus]NHA01993.1 hypothetical protein [Nocardioides convexus]